MNANHIIFNVNQNKKNFTKSDVASEYNVLAAAPTGKAVRHKKPLVPSKAVTQCDKAYGGGLEKRREMKSENKTSITNIKSNINAVGTDASWNNKVEAQKINKEADASYSAGGDASNEQVLLPKRASPATNFATHDSYTDPVATGNDAHDSDESSRSINSDDRSV